MAEIEQEKGGIKEVIRLDGKAYCFIAEYCRIYTEVQLHNIYNKWLFLAVTTIKNEFK